MYVSLSVSDPLSLSCCVDGTSSKRIDDDVVVYIFLNLSSAGSKICYIVAQYVCDCVSIE